MLFTCYLPSFLHRAHRSADCADSVEPRYIAGSLENFHLHRKAKMDSNGASCEGVPDLYKVLGVQRAATSVEVCGLVPSACVDNLHVQGIGRALQSAPAPATFLDALRGADPAGVPELAGRGTP